MLGPCRHREEFKPAVIVALQAITLTPLDLNDNASSPVGRDDPRISNATHQSAQPQDGGGFPCLKHLSVDAFQKLPLFFS